MPLKSQRELLLACLLAATAGYVDAVGFLDLGGFFVSFMSGNTTRMAAETTTSHIAGAGKALGLIGLFFVGTVAGGQGERAATAVELEFGDLGQQANQPAAIG